MEGAASLSVSPLGFPISSLVYGFRLFTLAFALTDNPPAAFLHAFGSFETVWETVFPWTHWKSPQLAASVTH